MKISTKTVQTFLAATLMLTLLGCGGGGGGGSNAAPGGSAPGGGGTTGGGTGGGGTGGGGTGGGGGPAGNIQTGGLVSGGLSLAIDTGTTDISVFAVTEGGTGASVGFGSIDRFSSIILDGRTINTDSAFIYVEGQLASQSDLRQGQSVAVITDAAGTTANGVFYRANVKGPATAVTVVDDELGQAELTVLGQRVTTNATTTFSNVDIADLVATDLYEVSGFIDAAGAIEATYIERKTTLSEYKVTGTVTNLTATTFSIQGLTVDYASATLQDFNQAIDDGDIVEVRGAVSDFTSPAQLVAAEVELLRVLTVGDAAPIEIDGYVDRFASAIDFDVQTLPITTNGATVYTNGDSDSIGLGVKLVARGTIQSDGVLLAENIVIQSTNAIRAEGNIEALDLSAGTLTVLGITFSTRDELRLEDKSSADLDPLTFGDLGLGDEVEVRGFLDGTEVVAMRIERDDPRDRARLRGPVSAEDAAAGTVTVLGVTLVTQAGITQYEDAGDNVITATEFHDLVEIGSFVRGDWDVFSDTVQPVDELSIED